jgi:predicted unusual protein kinase regulating ubiquinone biosynthesis (AarF/ABC1/UbiB family)
VTIPEVVFVTPEILVTRWMDGTPWMRLADADKEDRDTAGRALARFTMWSPSLVGGSHADPHPGNYRLLDDGTLGVLDFGSICHPSGPFTRLFARTFALDAAGDAEGLRRLWLDTGLIQPETTAEQLVEMLAIDPRLYGEPEVTFSREWTVGTAETWSDPLDSLARASRLAFPPDLLLEHRGVVGMVALLVGLEATVDFRAVLDAVPDSVAS